MYACFECVLFWNTLLIQCKNGSGQLPLKALLLHSVSKDSDLLYQLRHSGLFRFDEIWCINKHNECFLQTFSMRFKHTINCHYPGYFLIMCYGPRLQYLVHAQVISEREVLVSIPANVCDGVWSLALTEEITRRKLWWDSWRAENW